MIIAQSNGIVTTSIAVFQRERALLKRERAKENVWSPALLPCQDSFGHDQQRPTAVSLWRNYLLVLRISSVRRGIFPVSPDLLPDHVVRSEYGIVLEHLNAQHGRSLDPGSSHHSIFYHHGWLLHPVREYACAGPMDELVILCSIWLHEHVW